MMKVLKFQSYWCNPCKILDAQMKRVFELLEVQQVDIDVERGLTKDFNIRSIPTVVLLDENNVEIKRFTGSISDAKLKEFFE
jgi:thioredoxin 1